MRNMVDRINVAPTHPSSATDCNPDLQSAPFVAPNGENVPTTMPLNVPKVLVPEATTPAVTPLQELPSNDTESTNHSNDATLPSLLRPETKIEQEPYVSGRGRSVKPTKIFTLMCSFLAATSPNMIRGNNSRFQLLQPDTESESEPHPFALLSAFVTAAKTSDPDTFTLNEALSQPD